MESKWNKAGRANPASCGDEANLCLGFLPADRLLSGFVPWDGFGWLGWMVLKELRDNCEILGEISHHFLPFLVVVASILAGFQDGRAAPAQSAALLEARTVNL